MRILELENYTENLRNLLEEFLHVDLECSSSSDLQQKWMLQELQGSEKATQQALQTWKVRHGFFSPPFWLEHTDRRVWRDFEVLWS